MEKNYEERFVKVHEDWMENVEAYTSRRKSYDKRIQEVQDKIDGLRKEIERLTDERDSVRRPYPIDHILVPILELLNEAVADRGFQFETDDLQGYGITNEVPVFQDYSKSTRKTNAYFEFHCTGKGYALKVKSGVYACDTSIRALNDLDAKWQPVDSLQVLLDRIDLMDKDLEEDTRTEEEFCEAVYNDAGMLRFSVQPRWTYAAVTACMKAVAEGKYPRFEEPERIPVEMVDKEMFELGLDAGVDFYSLLPEEKLAEIGAYDDDVLEDAVGRYFVSFDSIPVERVTRKALMVYIRKEHYNIKSDLVETFAHLFDQEVADVLFERNRNYFSIVPDEFKTYSMCRAAVNVHKRLKDYVPQRYLNAAGNFKPEKHVK